MSLSLPASNWREAFDSHAVVSATQRALGLPARLRIGADLFQILATSIARDGAELRFCRDASVTAFPPGSLALLNVAGMTRPKMARIRWQRDDRFSVKFQDPLDDGELRAIGDSH